MKTTFVLRAMVGWWALSLAGAACFAERKVWPDTTSQDSAVADTQGEVTLSDGDTGSGSDTILSVDTVTGDTIAPIDTTPPKDTIGPVDTTVADTADADEGECDGPEDCGHLAGACIKVVCLAKTCAAQPDTGASCDDGEACTHTDVCDGYVCGGTPYVCDDQLDCTDDTCDGAGGCEEAVKPAWCAIAGSCVAAGEVKIDNACLVCSGGKDWSDNDGADCSDGDDVCTLDDVCMGSTCSPGPPPDDSAGDWAITPVKSTAPQTSQVQAVHPVGLGHWLMVTEVKGGGVVPATAGDVVLEDAALVAVRKAPAALFVDASFTGFERARLGVSDDASGRYALVGEVEGSGVVQTGSDQHVVSSTPGTSSSHLVRMSTSSAPSPVYVRELPHDVDAIAMSPSPTVPAFVMTGSTCAGVHVDDGDVDYTTPEGEQCNGFAIKYNNWGVVDWFGAIATTDQSPRRVGVCVGASGDIVIAAPFRSSARFQFPGGEVPVSSASLFTTTGYARVTAGGTVEQVMVPFTRDQELGEFSLSRPLQCTDDGFIASLLLGSVGDKVGSTWPLSRDGRSIVRMTWDGEITWALNIGGDGFGSPALLRDRLTIVAKSAEDPLVVTTLSGTPVYRSSSQTLMSVMSFTVDGAFLWAAEYPRSNSAIPIFAARSLLDDSIVVGGLFVGTAAHGDPNGLLPLTGGADVNSFAAKLNSAGGLACGSTGP